MSYHGDIVSQQTLYFTFTTNAAGVPTSLAGTPVLSVYKDDDVAQSTAGITLVADLDGVTGLNSVKIITTNAFYAVGHDYSVVITTGTVGGVSAVGYVVGAFSIQNRHTKDSAGVTSILADYARRTGDYATVGALMGLADDAITASKFDENTAFPLKAADASATILARVGDKMDLLDTLKNKSGASGYDRTTDSMEALGEGTGGGGLDAAGVRTAIGLTSANLDTQLSAIDTVADAVKVVTDQMRFTTANQIDANALSGGGGNPPSAADIADAVLNEAAAGHTGVIAVNLDAKVSSVSSAGGVGAITWVYNVKNNLGANIPDVSVWVTSDVNGTNVLASGVTDGNGNVTFYLDAGTVYVWSHKTGYNFTNPDTETVA